MSDDKFYDIRCVARVNDQLVPIREIYAIGPQFCGGEKHIIATVYPEAVSDIQVDKGKDDIPDAVQQFLDWCEANVIIPKACR